jgi:hypothetical protein
MGQFVPMNTLPPDVFTTGRKHALTYIHERMNRTLNAIQDAERCKAEQVPE